MKSHDKDYRLIKIKIKRVLYMNDKVNQPKHYQFGKFNAHTIIETVAKTYTSTAVFIMLVMLLNIYYVHLEKWFRRPKKRKKYRVCNQLLEIIIYEREKIIIYMGAYLQ